MLRFLTNCFRDPLVYEMRRHIRYRNCQKLDKGSFYKESGLFFVG